MCKLSLRLLALVLASNFVARAQGNSPPQAPLVTEPATSGLLLSPSDVHMVTAPMVDADPGDLHLSTDWEIWWLANNSRVWSAHDAMGATALHIHLGDGTFEGAFAGATALQGLQPYELRVRHTDDSGDPLTQDSPWSVLGFDTTAKQFWSPLDLEDVEPAPAPRWEASESGQPLALPGGARLLLEGELGQPLLELLGYDGQLQLWNDQAPLPAHVHARVRLIAGESSLALPASSLRVWEHGCKEHELLLPAVALGPGEEAAWWIAEEGVSFVAQPGAMSPSFEELGRQPEPPWLPAEPGWAVEEFATGFALPIDLAFVPHPGPEPDAPLLYVSELYGTIKVVQRDGQVSVYASGLLNFDPSGVFPGTGELGLTGLEVDPLSGDVFAALLVDVGQTGNLYRPEVQRLRSTDGGRTAATKETLVSFPTELHGPSHQISNLQLLGDGTLLVHMGDGFEPSTALNPSSYSGKVLRFALDGSLPTDNPFYDPLDGLDAADAAYAVGYRNPFGGALRGADGQLYVVENGPGTDRLSRASPGANFGWNGADASMSLGATHNWFPATGPVDMAFVQAESFGGSGFPADVQGHAFVTLSGPTWATGPQPKGKRIERIALDAAGALSAPPSPFLTYAGVGRGSCSGIAAGPDGLYFATLYEESGSSGPQAPGASILRVFPVAWDDCNGNGLSDACELAAGTSVDGDGNGQLDECGALPTLTADRFELSMSEGGTVGFALSFSDAPSSNAYLLLGSNAGTEPGVPLGAELLPLAPSPYLDYCLAAANGSLLQNTLGALGSEGEGAASLVVPSASASSLAGTQLHHAYVVLDLAGPPALVHASNSVPLLLLP